MVTTKKMITAEQMITAGKMITAEIYTEKQYYMSKCMEKQYLDGTDGDDTLIMAAMLTGKGLISENKLIHTIYGETMEEVIKALVNYFQANPNHPSISKIETS